MANEESAMQRLDRERAEQAILDQAAAEAAAELMRDLGQDGGKTNPPSFAAGPSTPPRVFHNSWSEKAALEKGGIGEPDF